MGEDDGELEALGDGLIGIDDCSEEVVSSLFVPYASQLGADFPAVLPNAVTAQAGDGGLFEENPATGFTVTTVQRGAVVAVWAGLGKALLSGVEEGSPTLIRTPLHCFDEVKLQLGGQCSICVALQGGFQQLVRFGDF